MATAPVFCPLDLISLGCSVSAHPPYTGAASSLTSHIATSQCACPILALKFLSGYAHVQPLHHAPSPLWPLTSIPVLNSNPLTEARFVEPSCSCSEAAAVCCRSLAEGRGLLAMPGLARRWHSSSANCTRTHPRSQSTQDFCTCVRV